MQGSILKFLVYAPEGMLWAFERAASSPQRRLDGVVHFLVAGFHQPIVYKPGTKPEDIIVPLTGTFINDATHPRF
jgi:hypothetical protein